MGFQIFCGHKYFPIGMDVLSVVSGTFTIQFKDKDLDHAFGQCFCKQLREDSRVERASHFSDYDADKFEISLHEKYIATVKIQDVVIDAVSRVLRVYKDLETHCGRVV